MRTERPVPFVAWAVLGIMVATSALAVLASLVSEMLALGVALGGVVTALLLAWAAQPAADAGPKPAERRRGQHHEAV